MSETRGARKGAETADDVQLRFIFKSGTEMRTTVSRQASDEMMSNAAGVWAGDDDAVPSQVITNGPGQAFGSPSLTQINLHAVVMITVHELGPP